ncbi:MAG: AmmeMemoRadiSam system protein A [Spirochaetaceae bacterium]|jgi:AmmeMemoRadiSam system protein A|nr:AmmeMemoRadiSam system protein A [Spirochaetaceae bacterium]
MEITITTQEREALLADARETISAALEGRTPEYTRDGALEAAVREGKSVLTIPCGAFVTLHKGAALRGCIGRMSAAEALEKTVRLMAAEAAFGDPRFPPLTRGEWEACTLEISVLSPLEPCPDPRSVQVGLHGLYLVHRGRSGVLLPQVPVEQGWNRDQYLDYICVKAGLPPHSWDEKGARLYTFTAAVFGRPNRHA